MAASWFAMAPDSLAARHRATGKHRYLQMFNLIWAVWIFGDLIFRNTVSDGWVLATCLSFPVFLSLYLLAYFQPIHRIAIYAVGIGVLGMVILRWNNSGGASYVIFSCAYLAFAGSVRTALVFMCLMVGSFLIEASLQGWPLPVMITMSIMALAVGSGNFLYRLNAEKDAELKLSHDEVRRLAAMAERERIGRDLHDLLGHTLSLIALKLELSRRLLDRDTDAARREMEDAEGVARHALAEVRAAVTGIRATGLAAELASAKLLLNSSLVHLDYENTLPALPARVEAGLALVLREAVTNIHRHARATRASVRVEWVEGELRFVIADNGKGGMATEGNGLCGMRERVRALGGKLVVESLRERGTTLRITVPLSNEDRLAAPMPQAISDESRLAS